MCSIGLDFFRILSPRTVKKYFASDLERNKVGVKCCITY